MPYPSADTEQIPRCERCSISPRRCCGRSPRPPSQPSVFEGSQKGTSAMSRSLQHLRQRRSAAAESTVCIRQPSADGSNRGMPQTASLSRGAHVESWQNYPSRVSLFLHHGTLGLFSFPPTLVKMVCLTPIRFNSLMRIGTWNRIFVLSSGAMHDFAIHPETPPASKDCKKVFGV